jgi:mannosyltransferase OCH1-like enzyme
VIEGDHHEERWSHCIKWTHGQTWENIDDIAGTRTRYAAKYKMPYVIVLLTVALALAIIQLFASSLAVRNSTKSSNIQRYVIFSFVAIITLCTGATSLSVNAITNHSAWEAYYDCDAGKEWESVPGTAMFLISTIILTFALLSYSIIFCPQCFWCVHLIQEPVETDSPQHNAEGIGPSATPAEGGTYERKSGVISLITATSPIQYGKKDGDQLHEQLVA